jgi:hypothetical protein
MKPMLVALALISAVPATLASAPAVAQGQEISQDKPLYDAEGKRVGNIDRVADQKWVKVIYKDAFVTIGWDTLSVKDGKVTTSLTRKEIGRLRS